MKMSSFRLGALALALALSAACGVPAALAQSCGDDIGRMIPGAQGGDENDQRHGRRRERQADGSDGVLRQVARRSTRSRSSCSPIWRRTRTGAASPTTFIDQLKAAHAKSVAFSGRACKVAAQMKKVKEQAASGGGAPAAPQLPAGPL